MHTQLINHYFGLLAAIAAALLASACGHRVDLTRAYLQQVQAVDGGQKRIRVLLSHRIRLEHGAPLDSEARVDGRLHLTHTERSLLSTYGRRVRGKILATKHIDGRRYIWVSFDRKCRLLVCAFRFAEHPSRKLFVLQGLPETLPPGATGKMYRGLKAHPLEFGQPEPQASFPAWFATTNDDDEYLMIHLDLRVASPLRRRKKRWPRGWARVD